MHRGGYVLLDTEAASPTSSSSAPAPRSSSPSQARELLAADGIAARVVSMPCREWFDAQETSYRETVIPPHVKARVSVEAGIALGWREVVGDHGRIVSIEHYGASADYERIYREYGITAEAVAAGRPRQHRRRVGLSCAPRHAPRTTTTGGTHD